MDVKYLYTVIPHHNGLEALKFFLNKSTALLEPSTTTLIHLERLAESLTNIPTGSMNDFHLFDPFILSVFIQQGRTKAMTTQLFTPLFVFIHFSLIIHFAPQARLLIDFKNRLTYFCILLFLSPDWLIFCHMIISLI